MCPFPVHQTQDTSGQATLPFPVGGEHLATPFSLAAISCVVLAVVSAVPGTIEKLTSLASLAVSFLSTWKVPGLSCFCPSPLALVRRQE